VTPRVPEFHSRISEAQPLQVEWNVRSSAPANDRALTWIHWAHSLKIAVTTTEIGDRPGAANGGLRRHTHLCKRIR